ncbi:CPBP family intramembrane metalloprotease [Paenisporosarcina quisquiliarum]|uniref:CPBP family intramembrane metalloprotease n=1 Tax=Paenisporosarcina quisquiliarum TaxID=365346 RepID=A0A9X3LEM5_9BACL|nr:CPBP family intramembrane glutamic endopeptidase [Paenisporosarcina quisquiliarum]MCZ8536503.1 CPBP family intramembrane metalloprotease [Paenisporosarcina quisquiliarum]
MASHLRWTVLLVIVYLLLFLTFSFEVIFWYMYTFTMLLFMALSFVLGKMEDEVQTWEYLIFGIGYGTLTYGLIATAYRFFSIFTDQAAVSVERFLSDYGPTTVWHYLLLMLIIAPGEELFWRGFIQQKLKRYMSPFFAVLVASLLFGLSMAFSGFWLGVLAAVTSGLLWGLLYEWKKSMPLIIIAHITMTILLFLVLPLNS